MIDKKYTNDYRKRKDEDISTLEAKLKAVNK
jgi:hypothetical protein